MDQQFPAWFTFSTLCGTEPLEKTRGFLWVRYPSSHPTNGVEAPKGIKIFVIAELQLLKF